MTTDDELEMKYSNGSRAAWVSMLQTCLNALGYDSNEAKETKWILEREMAISVLRQLCKYHGDNDWDESLNLYDIIEKHLWRHLE